MKKNNIIAGLLVIFCLLFLTACASQSIAEIKTKENIGKEVAVKGEVLKSFKIGSISGYILQDKYNETIGVSTQTLPAEGTIITAKGILMDDTIFGYYIKTE